MPARTALACRGAGPARSPARTIQVRPALLRVSCQLVQQSASSLACAGSSTTMVRVPASLTARPRAAGIGNDKRGSPCGPACGYAGPAVACDDRDLAIPAGGGPAPLAGLAVPRADLGVFAGGVVTAAAGRCGPAASAYARFLDWSRPPDGSGSPPSRIPRISPGSRPLRSCGFPRPRTPP